MQTTQELLEQIRRANDPRERWLLLEKIPDTLRQSEPLLAERLWWEARYTFTDKRKKLVQDKFVLFFLMLAGYMQDGKRGKRSGSEHYRQIFLSPALNQAISAEDRFFAELCNAAETYVSTLDGARTVMGLSFGRKRTAGERLEAVAGQVAAQLFLPIWSLCREEEQFETILRGILKGSDQAYPGVSCRAIQRLEESNQAEAAAFAQSLLD